MVASRIHDQARYRRNLEVKVDPSGSSTVKMRANSSAQGARERTGEHDRAGLTCGNTSNRHWNVPVITDQVLLLICGFGVQVPGGAPRLTWPYAILTHGPELRLRAKACKCVRKVSAA